MSHSEARPQVRHGIELVRRHGADHPAAQEAAEALEQAGDGLAAAVAAELGECAGPERDALLGLLQAWLRTDPETGRVGSLLELDPALDRALLEHLGDVPTPKAASLIQRLSDADDKAVAKAARRALHRLRSRGVEIPDRDGPAGGFSLSIDPDVRGEARAWRTGFDGNGARIVWMLTPSRTGGRRLLEAVVDDDRGVRRAHVSATTRKAVQEHLDGLRQQRAVLLAPMPAPRAAAILRRAEACSRSAGEELPAAYREWRSGPATVLFEDVPEDLPPSIYRHLEADAVRGRPDLLEASAELLGEPAFANWAHLGEATERAARRVREAEESRLAVDDEQRQELVESAVASAADDLDDDLRRRYRRRLESMAALLWETGSRERARQALAAALAFTEIDALYERHPLARALVQRGVFVAYRRQQEQGDEAEDSSRIILP